MLGAHSKTEVVLIYWIDGDMQVHILDVHRGQKVSLMKRIMTDLVDSIPFKVFGLELRYLSLSDAGGDTYPILVWQL